MSLSPGVQGSEGVFYGLYPAVTEYLCHMLYVKKVVGFWDHVQVQDDGLLASELMCRRYKRL